jgi:anti-sigma regulatory factor (Ser/Thr protein kinase)
MPIVEVTFTALPAHVSTARLIATAVGRRAGVPEEYLDEVRLAVGEACSRAVGLHQRFAPDAPVALTLRDDAGRYTVVVADVAPAGEESAAPDLDALDPEAIAEPVEGAGREPLPDLLPPGFGLAVIAGLVDDVSVQSDGSGTQVSMTWPTADAAEVNPGT